MQYISPISYYFIRSLQKYLVGPTFWSSSLGYVPRHHVFPLPYVGIFCSVPHYRTHSVCAPPLQRQPNCRTPFNTLQWCVRISVKETHHDLCQELQLITRTSYYQKFARHESNLTFLFIWRNSSPPPPQWARASSFTRFLDQTQRRTTVGRTPLDEWSARRRDLYLTTHNTHIRHPCPRWDSNTQSQQASGRWDRHTNIT